MIISKWLENKTIPDITEEDSTLLEGSTIKFLLLTKYGSYSLMYDTILDNDNLYSSYVSYIKPKLIELNSVLNLIDTFNPLEETETYSETKSYGKVNTNINNYTKTNTGTQTVVNDNDVTNSTYGGGTNTNYTSTYNTNTFENDVKGESSMSENSTITNDTTNTTTNNLSESNSGGHTDTLSGSDTINKTINKTNDNLFNDYVNNKIDVVQKLNLANYFVSHFIEIGAYLESGVFYE